MPSLQFSDIINSHAGKIGFVLGLGPSLARHIDNILELRKKYPQEIVVISCNNIDKQYPDLIPFLDFWMLAQPADEGSEFYIPNAYHRYNKNKETIFLYTDCLDLTPREKVASLLTVKYVGYDQRHWNSVPCGWKTQKGEAPSCCSRIIPGRKAIQEEFRDYCGVEYMYGAGDTVGVHMLSLSVLIGCKAVYVTGIDLDYSKGYANNDFPENRFRRMIGMDSVNRSPAMVDRILNDMTVIRDSAARAMCDLYSMDTDLKISSVFYTYNTKRSFP